MQESKLGWLLLGQVVSQPPSSQLETTLVMMATAWRIPDIIGEPSSDVGATQKMSKEDFSNPNEVTPGRQDNEGNEAAGE